MSGLLALALTKSGALLSHLVSLRRLAFMCPMARLSTFITLARLPVGTPGRSGGVVSPLLNAVQVHRDWTTAAVSPKPLVVSCPPKVRVPWVKYIIQGLGILHSLIQILRAGDQKF